MFFNAVTPMKREKWLINSDKNGTQECDAFTCGGFYEGGSTSKEAIMKVKTWEKPNGIIRGKAI